MPDQPLSQSPQDIERQRQSEAALRGVQRDSMSIGRSLMARQVAASPASDDKIELWGKRIGRRSAPSCRPDHLAPCIDRDGRQMRRT